MIQNLLLTLLSLSVGSFAHASTRSEFLNAMALLSQKKESQAFQVLEHVFVTSKNPVEQARAALLLLRAPNAQLKKHNRTFYAEHVLASKELELTEKETCRTLRIVGDAAYEDSDFEKARNTLTRMTSCSDIKESSYAAYKLGWVDLNEKQAATAFRRWSLMAEGRKDLPFGVKQPLIRDLGRAWAEVQGVSEKEARTASDLNFENEELDWFITGIKAGYRRRDSREEMAAFIQSLQASRYFDVTFASVLEEGLGFSREACQVLDWVKPYKKPFSEKISEELLPWVNRCAKEGKDSAQWVASTYSKLDLKGKNRWTRADYFRENGRIVDACLDMVRLFKESTEPKALPALATNCGLALKEISSVLDFQKRAETEVIALWPLLYENPALRPHRKELAGFEALWVGQTPLRQSLFKMLSDHSELFKGTLLPSLFAEGVSSESEKKRFSQTLLAKFVPGKLIPASTENQVWRELVRTDLAKHPREWSYERIEAALPLQDALRTQDDVALDLWLLWSLGQAEDTLDVPSFVNVLLKGYRGVLSPLRAETLFSMLLKNQENLSPAWLHWEKLLPPLIKGGHADSLASIRSFYDVSVEQIFRRELPPSPLRKSEQGKWMLALASTLDQGHVLESFELDKLLKDESKLFVKGTTPAILSEIKVLETLAKRLETMKSTRFTFSTSLPNRIKSRVGQIQASLNELGKVRWSHPKLLIHAQKLFVYSVHTLENRLSKIPRPSFMTPDLYTEFMEQLSPVRNQLEGWRNEIEPELIKAQNTGVQS